MRRRGAYAALVPLAIIVALLLSAATEGCTSPTTTTTETTMGTVPPMRALPEPWFGVTYESQSGASAAKIAKGNTALDGLRTGIPHLPFLRIVFDENIGPEQYDNVIAGYKPHAYILGEILDSFYSGQLTVAQFQARARAYITRHGADVDVWELYNEMFGGWSGPGATQVAKAAAAYDEAKARGKKTAITLWYNVGCVDTGKGEHTPLVSIDTYIPDGHRLRNVDYVLVSYYEVPCMDENGVRITESIARTFFQGLHQRFPNAKLGWGEVGLEQPTTATSKASALSILNHYYGMDLSDLPYFIGGGFWWYGWQDTASDWPDIMGSELKAGMTAMNAAIG